MEQLLVVSGRSLVKVAKIKSSIGIHGDVKIVPIFFTLPELKTLVSLCGNDAYAVASGNFPKKLNITDVEEKGTALVIKGSNSNVQGDLYVDEAIYRQYIKDSGNIFRLVGYKVIDSMLGEVGTVHSILRGKQDLVSLDAKEEKLFPFVNDLIESIDDDNKIIRTKLPEGIFKK